MNHETDVTFQGKNLDTVKGSSLHVGSDLLKFMEPVSMQESGTFVFRTPKLSHDANETLPLHLYVKSYGKNIDSKLHVTLYNCSFGRSDCSLCQAAHPDYRCAWCGGQSRCVYEALCNATSECPPPVITRIQPETGPSVAASASPSWAPIWVSEQRTSRGSPWLAGTAPFSRKVTLCPPGSCV